MEKVNLDTTDKKILYELDRNSRQSIADLSRKLRLGRDRVAYRMRRLQDEHVLRKFTTTVNPYKFGLIVYKTYLRLRTNRARIEKFVAALKKHPRTYWIVECSGKWDLMFATFAKTPHEFDTIQNDILSHFNDIVLAFSVYTLIDVWFFRKHYLVGLGTDHFFFGGKPEGLALDEIDFNILKLLSDNSRVSLRELSETLSITQAIAAYRIEKLERQGIIGRSVTAKLNLNSKFATMSNIVR